MINTTYEGLPGDKCVLYLTDDFTIEGFGSDVKSAALEGSSKTGLSVFVDDERESQTGEIERGWTVSRPERGKISQMFMIYSPDYSWKWPKERVPINECYPDFDGWLKDKSIEWFSSPKSDAKIIGNKQ